MVAINGLTESRMQFEINDTIKLELFGMVMCPGGWEGPDHSHDFWELIYIYKEQEDGYAFGYDGKTLNYNKNNIFLISPNKKHSFINYGQSVAMNMYIGFDFNFKPTKRLKDSVSIDSLHSIPEAEFVKSVFNEVITLFEKDTERVLDLNRIRLLECITKVAKTLTEDQDMDEDGKSSRSIILTEKVKKHIMKNLDKHIVIEEIAQRLYISPNYLGEVFKQTTGMTLKGYHNVMRMEYALRLLNEGEFSVSDVAQKLGFEDVAYFSRRFKEQYKISPSHIKGQAGKAK